MNAGEACVINMQSGHDISIPLHHINNQNGKKRGIISKANLLLSGMRENAIVRKLKLLFSAVFCAEAAAYEETVYRDSKTMLIVSGVIMAANYSIITSLPSSSENRDEGVRKGALLSATLSFMTTLLLMAAQSIMPTFDFRRVKMMIALSIVFTVYSCIVFTVYSYINFVEMKLGSSSQATVVANLIAAIYMFSIAILFISPKFRIQSPQNLE